jgi:hypothetical protein
MKIACSMIVLFLPTLSLNQTQAKGGKSRGKRKSDKGVNVLACVSDAGAF